MKYNLYFVLETLRYVFYEVHNDNIYASVLSN
jgi:hypothetical protein